MLEDLASTIGVSVADNKTVSDALRSIGETGLNASEKLLLAEEFLNDDAYSHFKLMAELQILPSLAGEADNPQFHCSIDSIYLTCVYCDIVRHTVTRLGPN